jgi:single-strand DNA-binding protein
LLSGREEGSGGGSRASSSTSYDQRPAASGADDFAQQAEITDDDIPF